jgi:hypothetical protein
MENLPAGKVMTGPDFEQPPAQPDDIEQVAFERIDATRFYTPGLLAPVPIEPGDLPASYGGKRLVLLPVDPYRIHVYWDLDSTAPPVAGARPVLRFHESSASPDIDDDTDRSRPFDVDANLAASRWYVQLWSPDKIYYAELGWRGEDGSFIQLARSNTVRTPPAWASPAAPLGEVVKPSPAAAPAAPESVPCEAVPDPAPAASVVPPLPDAFAHLQGRLAELFAIRGELPPLHETLDVSFATPFEAAEEITGEPFPLDTPLPSPSSGNEEPDLTQLSEERFTPGISSEWNSLGK